MAESKNNRMRRCSFCGRSDKEVRLMITGMTGFICDDCVEQAYQILQETIKQAGMNGLPELDLKKLPKPTRWSRV